jgi:hypothetical protein
MFRNRAAIIGVRPLKGLLFWDILGIAEQLAEKVDIRCPAPKGASDFEELTLSLKRYPDTKRFSVDCGLAELCWVTDEWRPSLRDRHALECYSN